MSTDKQEASRTVDKVNRLIELGLNTNTAMDVAAGKREEAFEVDRAQEMRDVQIWCKGRKNIPANLAAVWDCDPANFYLAFDGDFPGDHEPTDFVLITAEGGY